MSFKAVKYKILTEDCKNGKYVHVPRQVGRFK